MVHSHMLNSRLEDQQVAPHTKSGKRPKLFGVIGSSVHIVNNGRPLFTIGNNRDEKTDC